MSADGGHCIWYGAVRPKNADYDKNLVYNGPPKPLINHMVMESFREHCPNLAKHDELCCDDRQATNMMNGFANLDIFLNRCQNCIANLKKIICEFNCSPRQSEFVEVVKTVPLKNG